MSPSRGDFPKGMPLQLGAGRELEFGMVPSGMKGDVSLNVSMGSNSQMLPQKMREAGAGPEEMLKLRAGGADMLPAQQKMVPLPLASTRSKSMAWAPGRSSPCLRSRQQQWACGISGGTHGA